jgi:hypothetical protein
LGIGVKELGFEVLKVGIIKRELPLQGAITYPASALKDIDRLPKNLFKSHRSSLPPGEEHGYRMGLSQVTRADEMVEGTAGAPP